MLFVWIGFLNRNSGSIPPSVQERTSDFLGQPLIKIHFAGPLRDQSGERSAMMIIFEQDTREAANTFVRSSPYLQAGLYNHEALYEFDNEVG